MVSKTTPRTHFVRIELGSHEWGFWLAYIPAVGDDVLLEMSEPDKPFEAESEFYTCRVVSRTWFPPTVDDPYSGDLAATLVVETSEELNGGHVSNSEEWPAKESGRRKREIEDWIQELKESTPDA